MDKNSSYNFLVSPTCRKLFAPFKMAAMDCLFGENQWYVLDNELWDKEVGAGLHGFRGLGKWEKFKLLAPCQNSSRFLRQRGGNEWVLDFKEQVTSTVTCVAHGLYLLLKQSWNLGIFSHCIY